MLPFESRRKAMKTILLFAAFAASVTASPASAEAGSAPPASQRVGYADLDLSSHTGRHILDRRIRAAANMLCGTPSSADARGISKIRKCRAATSASVEAQRNAALQTTRQQRAALAAKR